VSKNFLISLIILWS